MNFRTESAEHYQKALKTGQKEYRHCVHHGIDPYLQVLDDLLPAYQDTSEVNLGLIRIPIEKIVGTKTEGRTNAFSAGFLPLLPEDSEFGLKWKSLCEAHLSDVGIRDPISCYEFLGRFYVQEGNKRVSVLKYFGAASVVGNVIRIVPGAPDSPEVRAYHEFLSYYPLTKLYEVYFTDEKSFPRLQAALGFDADHVWTEEERRYFLSGHSFFSQAYQKLGGLELSITTADAMLEWLKVYPFSQLKAMSSDELFRSVEAMWSEIKSIGYDAGVEIHTQDLTFEEKEYRNRRTFSLMPSYLHVAFIHEMNPQNSNWIRAHEEGAAYLERIMGEQVVVQRFFDVGIAEGHAVTFSGGMAKDGLLPLCNIYSSFMQRAYDNVIHDIAIQKLNVVLCLDRAGLVGEDGPTHHGAFDLAYMRPIPNLIVASPYNEHELRCLMYTAQLPDKGPFVIRYPRGRGSLVDWKCPMQEIEIGKGRKLKEGKDIAVITLGPIGVQAEKAITHAEQETGKSIAHYDLRFLKPLDESMLHEIGKRFKQVVTVEDGVLKGGMGSAILEFMADNEYNPQIKRIGLPDQFVQHGSVKELYHICGMDEEGIYKVLISF